MMTIEYYCYFLPIVLQILLKYASNDNVFFVIIRRINLMYKEQ
jgi:hypothetical protein